MVPSEIITLKSTESSYSYTTRKNKKKNPERLERKKFDPILKRYVVFREKK
ncbi:MAG: 50S ribosomal protein L33 [Candidatus Omnitrophica bacterium]|nr:50S ribosomal protein L33 [Candidatus Omnitrophota bacterium]